MSDSLRVIVSEHLDEHALKWLSEKAIVIQTEPAHVAAHLSHADGLVVRTYTHVDTSLLDRAPRLRVVGRAGTGLDNVDVHACRARGVNVVYAPEANTQAVVEYVLGIVSTALRPLHPLAAPLDEDAWRSERRRHVAPRQWSECTVGVLGVGRIGRRLAQVAGAIGATVLGHDLRELSADEAGGARMVDRATLMREADIVTIHVDGRAENLHLITAADIRTLRDEAILVNTSRGFVVDNLGLAHALRKRPDLRAYLDVHDPEPIPEDHPLWTCPNAVLYPHLASRTQAALHGMSAVVHDVVAVLEGRPPRFPAP